MKMALARAGVLAVALAAAGCGARLMRLPDGPGGPASDGAAALAQANRVCTTINSMTAEASVSGRVGGQRLRARLLLGVAAPDRARIEAVAFGQPVFTFVASGGDATLVLTQDNRVLEHGPPAGVLEAVTGAPLDPAALRAVLTGCATPAETVAAQARGADWRVISTTADSGSEWYLRRENATSPWRLVASRHRPAGQAGWRAEYREFVNDVPMDVRLTSDVRDRFNLRLRLTDPERNVALGDEAFAVVVPRSASPITLEELRRSGPLASADER